MHGEGLLWGEATWSGQRELAVRSRKEPEGRGQGRRRQGTGTSQGMKSARGNNSLLTAHKLPHSEWQFSNISPSG